MDNRNSFSINPYIRETTKIIELNDHFGNIRFKVALVDFGNGPDRYYALSDSAMRYRVAVVSYCYAEDPITIVCREFDVYTKAMRFFDNMVVRYSALVKAETRDYQDIRIYAEKTGYHRICPDCCSRCKWAKPVGKDNCLFEDWKKDHRGKFLCMNSQLYSPDRYDMQADWAQHDGYHDHAEPRRHIIDIHPEVDFDGICEGFERKDYQQYRDPKHSDWTFRYHDLSPEMLIDTIAKAKVMEYIENSLETIIIPEVGKRIDEKLENDPPTIEGNRGGTTVFNGGAAD